MTVSKLKSKNHKVFDSIFVYPQYISVFLSYLFLFLSFRLSISFYLYNLYIYDDDVTHGMLHYEN